VAARRPVGTTLASIGAGATTGAAVITAGVAFLRILQSTSGENPSPETSATVLFASLFAGVVAAVASGWRRAKPIGDYWRRAAVATLSVSAAVLLALPAAAADLLAGVTGLIVYVLILTVASGFAHATARRAGRQ
jgi:hypothetical protein